MKSIVPGVFRIACLFTGLSCCGSVSADIHVVSPVLRGNVAGILMGATQVETFEIYDSGFDYIHHNIIRFSRQQALQIRHGVHPLMNTKYGYVNRGKSQGKAFISQFALTLLATLELESNPPVHSFAPHFAVQLRRQRKSVLLLMDFSARQIEMIAKDENGRTTFKIPLLAMGAQEKKFKRLIRKAFPYDPELRLKNITYAASQRVRARLINHLLVSGILP